MGDSDAEIREEIQRVATRTDAGGAPSIHAYRDHGEIPERTVLKRFGSWNDAVEAAGFEPNTDTDKISRVDLIEELHRLRDAVGEVPTADQMDDQGAYAYITYYERFGSWGDALEEAFGEVPNRTWEHVSDAELCAELHRVSDGDEPPTTSQLRDRGEHAFTTYEDRFGSWREALAAAGFEPPRPQAVTNDALLAELRRLRDELGTRPTTRDIREHGEHAVQTYYERFESWGDALDRAFDESDGDGISE